MRTIYFIIVILLGTDLPADAGETVAQSPAPGKISSWIAVGPFASSTESDAGALDQALITEDCGLGFTGEENHLDLKILLEKWRGAANEELFREFPRHEMVDFYTAFGIPKGDLRTNLPSFYVQAEVVAPDSARAYLLIGSGGALKIWLNGELAGTVPQRRLGLEPYNACLPLNLRKGRNTFLFKVARVWSSAGIMAELVNSVEEVNTVQLGTNGSFLENILVSGDKGFQYQLRGSLHPTQRCGDLRVLNPEGREVAVLPRDSDAAWQPDQAIPGVYSATLKYGDVLYREQFLVGEVRAVWAQLSAHMTQQIASAPRDRINFDTYKRRMEVLLAAEAREKDQREWQRKCVYTLGAVQQAISARKGGRDAWTPVSGVQLRGVISLIDGGVRHYRLFVPDTYQADRPLPLAIVVPTAFSAMRPYLESAFVSSHLEAEAFGRIANECGIGILWPGYLTQPNGNPAELAYFDQVLATVSAEYNIDETRLYLLGTCQAGSTATLMAQHWPRRFAALGLLDPIPYRKRNSRYNEHLFDDWGPYRNWIREREPLLNCDRLQGLPLCVVHDDGAVGHGSLSEAKELVDAVEAARGNVTFEQVPLSLNHLTAWRHLIQWVVAHAREGVKVSYSGDPERKGATVGSIANELAGGFTLVVGTHGSSQDQSEMERIARGFQEGWRAAYFNDCRVVKDDELTADMERSTNLILLGNQRTNSVWKSLDQELKVQLSGDAVTIESTTYPAPHASLEGVFVNPRFSRRAIVVIGADDLRFIRPDIVGLVVNGWYRYGVWSADLETRSHKLTAAVQAGD